MLGFKGVGFVAACIYSFFTSIKIIKEFVRRYAWPYIPFLAKRPEDKFAEIVDQVILQVSHTALFILTFHVQCALQRVTNVMCAVKIYDLKVIMMCFLLLQQLFSRWCSSTVTTSPCL